MNKLTARLLQHVFLNSGLDTLSQAAHALKVQPAELTASAQMLTALGLITSGDDQYLRVTQIAYDLLGLGSARDLPLVLRVIHAQEHQFSKRYEKVERWARNRYVGGGSGGLKKYRRIDELAFARYLQPSQIKS